MRGPVVVFACLCLAACSTGLSKALEYNQRAIPVEMPDDTYRLFEHPDGTQIMTTPSLGRVTGQGLAQGVTLGLAHIRTPEQLHEAAVRKHLDDTGREHCRIVSGYLLVDPQYEFTIDCSAEPA